METYTSVEDPENPDRFFNYELMTDFLSSTIEPESIVIETFHPMSTWVPSAQGLCHFSKQNTTAVATARGCLETLGYVAATLAYAAPQGTQHPTVFATMEMVPGVDKKTLVGLRLRVSTTNPALSIGQVLNQRFFATGKENMKQLKKGKAMLQTGARYTKLDYEQYRRLCIAYNPDIATETNTAVLRIEDKTCPLYPSRIFSIQRSMHLAKKAGAHPDFCQGNHYQRDEDGAFQWPYPEQVYMLDPKQLNPLSFFKYFFPHIPRAPFSNLAERNNYILENAASAVPTAEETRRYGAIFDQQMSGSISATEEKGLVYLAGLIKPRMLEAKTRARNTPDLTRIERIELEEKLTRDVFLDALELYGQVVNPYGAIGDAPKAMLAWQEKFLEANDGSMCLPTERVHDNISRGAEYFTQMAVSNETAHGLNTTHGESATYYVSALAACCDSPLKPHQLHLGDAKAGKSFLQENAQLHLIDGTWMNVTYQSAKAMASPGCKMDNMNVGYEEMIPSMLGIDPKHKGGDGTTGDETDMASFMKSWLSTGVMTFMVKRVLNGIHETIKHTVRCAATVFGNGNFNRDMLGGPMASRFLIVQHQLKDRDPSAKNARAQDTELRQLRNVLLTRPRRTQCLSMHIWFMITCGMLPGVDLSVANIIFTNVLRLARKRGLADTDDPRHMTRLRVGCAQNTIIQAISVLFDSLDSPLRGQPFSLAHLWFIRKHLVALSESATIALGMFQEQYEQKSVYTVLRHMKDKVFDKVAAIADAAAHFRSAEEEEKDQRVPAPIPVSRQTLLNFRPVAGMARPSVEEEKKEEAVDGFIPYVNGHCRQEGYYYACRIKAPAWCSDNHKLLITNLCSHLYQQMSQPKPALSEIHHAIQELCTMFVSVGKDTEERVPALEVLHGEYRIACSLVDGVRPNVLRDCTKEILCHPYAKKRTLLWGHTNPELPYQYDILQIAPIKIQASDPRTGQLLWEKQRDVDTNEVEQTPLYKNALSIVDPKYFDAELVRLTKALVDVESREHYMDFDSMFSQQEVTPVDTDLDDYGLSVHYANIAMLPKRADLYPAADPLVRQDQELESARQKACPMVPNTYPSFKPLKPGARSHTDIPFKVHGLKRRRELLNPTPDYRYVMIKKRAPRPVPVSPLPALERGPESPAQLLQEEREEEEPMEALDNITEEEVEEEVEVGQEDIDDEDMEDPRYRAAVTRALAKEAEEQHTSPMIE